MAGGYVCKGGVVRLSDYRLHRYGADLIVAFRVGTVHLLYQSVAKCGDILRFDCNEQDASLWKDGK